MGVVGVVHLIIVCLHVFYRPSLVVGEGEVLTIALEVVLRMTLSADEGAHVLVRLLGDVFPTTSPSLIESGASGLELHCASIVTVRAADRIDDLWPPLTPGSFVKLRNPLLLHQAGYVRALTSPTGTRLDIFLAVYTRGTCA